MSDYLIKNSFNEVFNQNSKFLHNSLFVYPFMFVLSFMSAGFFNVYYKDQSTNLSYLSKTKVSDSDDSTIKIK